MLVNCRHLESMMAKQVGKETGPIVLCPEAASCIDNLKEPVLALQDVVSRLEKLGSEPLLVMTPFASHRERVNSITTLSIHAEEQINGSLFVCVDK